VVSSSPSDRNLSQVGMLLILWSHFTTSMEEKERCYFFILSRTPHETWKQTKEISPFWRVWRVVVRTLCVSDYIRVDFLMHFFKVWFLDKKPMFVPNISSFSIPKFTAQVTRKQEVKNIHSFLQHVVIKQHWCTFNSTSL
jgi:hypothetical protein